MIFAVPGRIHDMYSQGCNQLIRNNKAALVQNADDIAYQMGWTKTSEEKKARVKQQRLFHDLTTEQKLLVDFLTENGCTDIDSLCHALGLSPGKAATALLQLEFEGLLRTLPGKSYELL